MAKVIDITEKLAFDENPRLKIKDVEVEVESNASTVLKIVGLFTGEDVDESQAALEAYELIFSEAERDKIDQLGLSLNDLMTLINAAADALMGKDEPEGE
ncbi:hypothetical protein NE619_09780 [Anaerovorax odorimutans]|uniref:Uncharacterized protein n=1 Tax=Anaerovorax odorimutans TaxID=109327 RepID=A0ABT1RPC4_9FIRM|nr:hypothetical protein [Anaerovorax odorimutans]MCQ4637020.1 hypothetical protein [Anaerovorax odorimutans]